MKKGERYNWKHQKERLLYVGKLRRWHQFEQVNKPGVIWCEVLDEDLHMLEKTTTEGESEVTKKRTLT